MAFTSSRLVVESREPATVVRFVNDDLVDSSTIQQLAADFDALIESIDQPPQIIIDFTNVEHFSSEAMGMLITLNKKLKEAGGKLRLADVSDEIRKVFDICRLGDTLSIYKTVNQALTSLKYLSQ